MIKARKIDKGQLSLGLPHPQDSKTIRAVPPDRCPVRTDQWPRRRVGSLHVTPRRLPTSAGRSRQYSYYKTSNVSRIIESVGQLRAALSIARATLALFIQCSVIRCLPLCNPMNPGSHFSHVRHPVQDGPAERMNFTLHPNHPKHPFRHPFLHVPGHHKSG